MPEDYFTPIWLHIQSPGGDLFAGLALADQLSRVKSPIHSIVEGFAASAATLVSMSCSKRFIQPSAFILMHQLGGANFGAYDELQDKMHLLDMMMEVVTEFYVNKTGLEKEVIKNILSRDSWFSAKESLELGLVDEIL
jgi:ATP-dependent Clp protease protease subunit